MAVGLVGCSSFCFKVSSRPQLGIRGCAKSQRLTPGSYSCSWKFCVEGTYSPGGKHPRGFACVSSWRYGLDVRMRVRQTQDGFGRINCTWADGNSQGGLAQDFTPASPDRFIDREKEREDRRLKGLVEYEALKQNLSSTTLGVAVAIGMYCLVALSAETACSYGIGSVTSLLYLRLLYQHVDRISEENVPFVFVQRKVKKIGFRSSDLQDLFEKVLRGSSRSLSSSRLAIPAGLFGSWAASEHFPHTDSFHLQLTPLLLGFFAYKGAALIQVYRDNKDLLMAFADDDEMI